MKANLALVWIEKLPGTLSFTHEAGHGRVSAALAGQVDVVFRNTGGHIEIRTLVGNSVVTETTLSKADALEMAHSIIGAFS